MPTPITHPSQPVIAQTNYNAVKIDIHNPQVNAPSCPPAPVQAPVYTYPQAPIYEVPKQSIYTPKPAVVPQPPAMKEVPTVPPPVIVQPTITQTPAQPIPPVATPATEAKPVEEKKNEPIVAVNTTETPGVQPKSSEVKEPEAPAQTVTNTTTPDVVPTEVKAKETEVVTPAPTEAKAPEKTEATPQTVEIKAPEKIKPQFDISEVITKLTNPDYEVQATTMESIAELAQKTPEKATELLDVKVLDTLLGIMNADSTKLEGPSDKQLEIRDKIISGKAVTEEEAAEASKSTPKELVERNKQFAIYTVAILQKVYVSEIEKMNNTVVPLTELPGAAGIVEQIKSNPNPMVRISAIDALSYIQRPEYKQDLTTILTVAQNDVDKNVQSAAKKALEKLAKVADAHVAQAPTAEKAETAKV